MDMEIEVENEPPAVSEGDLKEQVRTSKVNIVSPLFNPLNVQLIVRKSE